MKSHKENTCLKIANEALKMKISFCYPYNTTEHFYLIAIWYLGINNLKEHCLNISYNSVAKVSASDFSLIPPVYLMKLAIYF